MVLVECEYCRSRGILVAYHEDCFKKAMSGAEITLGRRGTTITCGGAQHLLTPVIEELMTQRESEDVPVLIPAQYEACYQCGIFRGGGKWFLAIKGLNKVKGAIRLRREQFNTSIIGGDSMFGVDATLEDFYGLQPKF